MVHSRSYILHRTLRKSWHVAGIAFPVAYWAGWASRDALTVAAASITLLMTAAEGVRFAHEGTGALFRRVFGKLMREEEYGSIHGSVPYLFAVFISFAMMPPALACVGVACLAVGDAAADVFGTSLGKTRLLGGKTLEGSIACAASCWLVCWPWVGWKLAIAGAVAAAAGELFSPRPYDNMTVPFAAAAGIYALSRLAGIPYS